MMAGHKPPYTLDEIYAVAQAGDILRAREMFNVSVRFQSREAAREATPPVPEHKHEFGDVIGWGEHAVRLCACGLWILAAPAPPTREGLAALVEQCQLAEEAITGTLLARMQDVEAARRTVALKAAVQELAAWLAQGDRRDA